MSDNFRDLIEADASSLLARAGQAVADKVVNKGKEIGYGALAAVGSARGAGKLDLTTVTNDLSGQFKYFLKTQQQQPTLASFLDFVKVAFGMDMPEGDAMKAIYGYDPTKMPKPPQIMAPHQAVLKDLFKVIFNAKSSQQKLLTAAQDAVRYAENNDADEDYVVIMVKWMAAKNPQMLDRPGMDPLKGYAHGGRLEGENLAKILKGFASVLLRQMMIAQRDADTKAAAGGDKPGEPGAPDTEGDDAATADQSKKKPSTPTTISFDPPALEQEGEFGGLKPPATGKPLAKSSEIITRLKGIAPDINMGSFESWAQRATGSFPDVEQWWLRYRDGIDGWNFHKLNAFTAQLVCRAADPRYGSPQDFVSYMDKFQKDDYGQIVWQNARSLKTIFFARRGGNFDEITAELNHVADNSTKAAMIYIGVLRFIADMEAKRAGGGAPAPAGGTPPAGGAPAGGAPAAGGGQP